MTNLKTEAEKYIDYCFSHKKLSPLTIKAYRTDLKQFIAHRENMTLSKEDITEYIDCLHKSCKPKTVRRKIASLKAFTHYLCYEDILEYDPFGKIDTNFREPKLLPRTIPEYIIAQLIGEAYSRIKKAHSPHEYMAQVRNAAVIELLFATGARISEICSLSPKDIDINNHTVRIMGKGSKERIIHIENNDVLKILKRYESLRPQNEDSFFINNREQRLSEQSVRGIIKNLEESIDSYIHITPHMFRHSVATMLLEEDVDISYIQKLLGHSSISTTQIYTHVSSSKLKEIIRTKHPRNRMAIRE